MKPYLRRGAPVLLLIALLSLTAHILTAQTKTSQNKDPFLGTWLLDADKSRFVPGPGPQDRTMIFEARDGGMHHTTKTLNAFLGTTDDIDYTAKFDGKDYPITGTGLDTISLKRIDAHTIERSGKVRGKVAETGTMKVSPDGKVMTVSLKGSYKGTDYSSVQILTRE